MDRITKKRLIGFDPPDERTCALLSDDKQILLEAYVYEVGFFRFNWHPSLEILFCLNGKMKTYTEHGVFDLEEDDFAVISPNEAHSTRHVEKGTCASALHISVPYIEQLGVDPLSLPVMYDSAQEDHASLKPLFHNALSLIYLSLIEKKDNRELLVQAQTSMLLYLLARPLVDRHDVKTPKMTLARLRLAHTMIDYIDRHFREKISLSEVAELVKQNPSSASTLFSSYAGVGFHEYLTRKRLHHAAYLLNNTNATLMDISGEAGFPDVKSFHAAFKKYLFQTPGAYRKTVKAYEDYEGTSVKNRIARRFPPTDPLVKEKMSQYLFEHAPLSTILHSS